MAITGPSGVSVSTPQEILSAIVPGSSFTIFLNWLRAYYQDGLGFTQEQAMEAANAVLQGWQTQGLITITGTETIDPGGTLDPAPPPPIEFAPLDADPLGGLPQARTDLGTLDTGGDTVPPLDPFLDPRTFQPLFNQAVGIPRGGAVNPYQQFLATQFGPTLAAYTLGATPIGATGLTLGGQAPNQQTFADYIGARGAPARVGGGALSQFSALPADVRADFLTGLPTGTRGDVEQGIFSGALRQQYAPFITSGLTRQAFGDPSRGAFGISPFGTEGGPLGTGGTFLEYLRRRYGL